MQLEVQHGVIAKANCRPGAVNQPAALALHGFLQPREFPTMRCRASALADEGYRALAPTLIPIVNRRQQSLACAAVHPHAIGQNVYQRAVWARWPADHAGKPLLRVGRSAGGVRRTAVLASNAELPAHHAVLISRNFFDGPTEAGGVTVRSTPGASHFFDRACEFELLDHVVAAIEETGRG